RVVHGASVGEALSDRERGRIAACGAATERRGDHRGWRGLLPLLHALVRRGQGTFGVSALRRARGGAGGGESVQHARGGHPQGESTRRTDRVAVFSRARVVGGQGSSRVDSV